KHAGEYLRSLGQRPPTPEARAEVESYLTSKWQGLQAIAAEVLGTWGGRESARLLRELLVRSYQEKRWWAIAAWRFGIWRAAYRRRMRTGSPTCSLVPGISPPNTRWWHWSRPCPARWSRNGSAPLSRAQTRTTAAVRWLPSVGCGPR